MKAKMSYKSKKIAIITAVVLVLIAAISVGTYFFVQGNDNAQAAYTENDNLAQTGNGESDTTETNNGSEGQTNPTDEQNDGNDDEQSQDDETPEPTMPGDTTTSGNDADQTVGDNDGDNNNAGTTTGTTNNGNDTDDNTDTEIPNEEYTQTDIIETEVERIEQQVRVGWSNIGLANAQMSTNILTNRPNLTLNKTSKIINSLGENDNAAREGSEIIYEISITNNSENIDATGVNVSDIVPTGTTLKENSISNNGTVENGRISWIVDVARNSTVTVSFTVIVDETATEISNVAVVDGKDTPETTNPIIETYKSSTSTSEVLEEGSEVTYTISVENKGNTTATTTVRDVVPEGTTLVAESLNGYENVSVVDNVITWNNVEVAGGETVELEFTVTINGFEGESIQISNTATVGDKDTNTNTIDVYNPVITLTKVADKAEVKEGDIITYTMTATNTGRVDGTAIISDAAPQGTTGLEGTITVNDKETEYTLAELEAGIPVEVAKNGGEATVSFQVQVNNNSGLTTPISNTAYLVDEDNPEDKTPTEEPTTTDVYGEIVFEENGGSKVEDITGVAGDKIEDTTMPETTRLGYDFGGWYDNAECEGNAQETLPEIMKAGTTTYYAKWTARTDTAYTVEHYLQDLDGEGYTLTETEPKTGTTGTEVTAEPKSYTGFTFDNSVEGTVQTGTIAGDGSLVLRLYYTRNSYKVTYTYEGTAPEGASELPEEATYKYGASVEVAGNATAPGYTFSGWDSDDVEIAENEFTMPAQDVVITGSFTANTNTAYKVEHYLQDLDGEGYKLTETETKAGTTGTQVTADPKSYTGFTFDRSVEGTVQTGTIAGDGSLVLKLYYTRNSYKVTYAYEGTAPKGASELPEEATYKYGVSVEVAGNATAPGYTFSGWDSDNVEIAENEFTMPAQDVVITGSFTANTNTAYKVEHYLQDLDGEGYKLTETETKAGTTGTQVTADPKSYTGFTFDRSVEGTVQTGTIAGDGSLVLKLYYTRNSYKVTYAYEGTAPKGASELPEEATYKYGVSVEVAGNATAPGYTFSGWDSDNVEIAENEFTMPAQDVVITGSFTLDPSLTLTKTALDEDRNPIQNGYVYKENGTNYMYYRLTVTNNGPEAVEEQIITDTLPYGMTYIDEGNTNISQETVEEQGKNKTRITWTIDGIEAYGSATVDIKVQIDERVFEGVDQVEDSEYNVISDITAISPENTDDEYQTTDTTGKKMSLFVRFASPVSGNSGYLYAGTTTAADSGMPTANNDLYVQKYNGTGRYTDGEIDGNLENAQLLANMLDDFYTANTDGTIASYVAGNRLPNEEDVKDFLEREYKITLDSNHTILWYKVSERAGEKARTRRYDITNKETYASYTEYVYMSACTYHLDGIIVDINSFNRIPDGSDIDVQNTAYVRTVDKSNWLNTEASADVTIYYNARPVNINLTTDRLTRLSETTDANNVTAKINAINAAPVGEQEETTGLESETEEFDAIGEIIEDDNKEESGTIGSSNATGQSESSEGDNATEQSESPEGDNTTGQLESPEEGNTTETDVEQTTPIVKEDMEENSEFTDESATSEDVVGVNSIPNEESDYEIKDEEATGSEAQENEKIEEDQSVQEEILEE